MLFATQPVPSARWVIGCGVVALVLIAHRRTWPWIRLATTVVHEAGHALVAVLVGRRLAGIRVHSDTSGVTVSRGRPRGPGMVVMLMAGYLAPGVLGLVAALLFTHGRALVLLWLLVAVLLGVLVWVRNGYGLVTVLVLGVGLGLVTRFGDARAQAVLACGVAWILLLAAPRPLAAAEAALAVFLKDLRNQSGLAMNGCQLCRREFLHFPIIGNETVNLAFDVGGLRVDTGRDSLFPKFGQHIHGSTVAFEPLVLILRQTTVTPIFSHWIP